CSSRACGRSWATTRASPPSSRPCAASAIASSGAGVSDRFPAPAVYQSVFARLLVIMLVMALVLMGLVIGFFPFIVNPNVSASLDRMLGDYARRIAAESPGLAEARRLGDQLDVRIRYEGPDGSWTTDETLPTIAEALADSRGFQWIKPSWGHGRYLVN